MNLFCCKLNHFYLLSFDFDYYFESGIIDPTKVVRCSLENAAAAAVTLLMTECVINEKPDAKKKDDMGGMAGFGM